MEDRTNDPLHIDTMQLPGGPSPEHQPDLKKSGFSVKKIVFVVIGFLALLGIGFGFALLTGNGEETPAVSQVSQPDDTATPKENADSDVPAVAGSKTHKADFPRVEFTYPENWIVTANRDQESIRIESPEFNYPTVNGSTVKGHFRIYIRQGARQADSKYIGRGIAALPSEKLAYTNPPAGQRPETNLSFFGLDSSDHFAYFLIAGNFALEKNESLGPEYGTEPETYIIAGGYTSNELNEDLATNPVPLEYFGQTNAYKQAVDILKSLKLL